MHRTIDPAILYFGTPVVLVSSLNEDGTPNVAPMSSAWWLGQSCLLGFGARSKTPANILRTGECVLNLPSVDEVAHVERHPYRRLRMVVACAWDAADAHPVIADGPDLLDAVLLRQLIDTREDIVQDTDEGVRWELQGNGGRADEIGEEHGRTRVCVGDATFAGLEAVRDLLRQDVQQQAF